MPSARSRTSRSTILPELPQFLPDLAARTGPVETDTVPELGDVAAEIQLVLLEPADVEFLAGGAALELAGYVFFVVADDSAVSLVRTGRIWCERKEKAGR
jgi:hypothetical protein